MNLYIHIPFCAGKCSYCHFYSISHHGLIEPYLAALAREIDYRVNFSPTTVYFGGGTPSLLLPSQLQFILNKISLAKTTEITLEAHPNTLSSDRIKRYSSLGINRLSLGIQSWNSKILKHMGREYDRTTLPSLVKFAQSRGLTNINFDHIIAYPGQTDRTVTNDVLSSLALKPAHISIYPLERHRLTRIKRSPPENKIIRQFALVQKLLIQHGYRHYEELNFCRKGYECRHNLDFWHGGNYFGIGASAVSRLGTEITTNTSNIGEYIKNPTSSNHAVYMSTNQLRQLQTEIRYRVL